jgi:branched-chain amino acid transport system permease protein
MFLQQIINGIVLGSIYALMAIGYAMVFSLLELINFSHGQVFMFGAYIGLYASKLVPGNILAIFGISMMAATIVGIGVHRIAVSPLRKRSGPKVSSLITTLAMGIIIENAVLVIFGSKFQGFKPPFTVHYLDIYGIRISSLEIIIILLSLGLMILISLFMYKTKYGMTIRACSQDMEITSLMGVNVNTIVSATFAVGSILAAVAGVLIGYYYNFVEPSMGAIVGLKGFTASVLGGRGMISGGALGGLVLGIIESLGTMAFSAQYRDSIAFTLLILILLFKPEGLLGKRKTR